METWVPEDAELAVFSAELDETFRLEQSVLSAGLVARVKAALPHRVSPLLRAARALTGVVLLAAVAVAGLCWQLISASAGGCEPLLALRVTVGAFAVIMAVLVALSAPRIVLIDCRIMEKLTGYRIAPTPLDLLLVRTGALMLVLLGGFVMV